MFMLLLFSQRFIVYIYLPNSQRTTILMSRILD
ncbi:hypothetical protein Slin_4472 [Spirosoma linguale DSM 74]|uniref:Uncharacterized protein n=1 Tax=Spirosoma linguale (strain ATCC 33905 / DSM 74 / LMG 10896 / Claus 1) TaxID=504472 RepID=D2QMN9_SPILD|nr:hypothetical protein Slin_4472 [Spirosoma linguale DSM 74]